MNILRPFVVGLLILIITGCAANPPLVSPNERDSLLGRWTLLDSTDPGSNQFDAVQFNADGVALLRAEEDGLPVMLAGIWQLIDSKLFVQFGWDYTELTYGLDRDVLTLIDEDDEVHHFQRVSQLWNFHPSAVDADTGVVMPVTRIALNVKVVGRQAITSATYDFQNLGNDETEAELTLSLPAAATVLGYALDIEGEMVAGVAVPKERARQVFQTIEDEGIDPGIAEIVRGNAFRTEVYPVLPGQTRRIRVDYIEPLTAQRKNHYIYSYPFSEFGTDTEIDIAVSVAGATRRPGLAELPGGKGSAMFMPEGELYRLTSKIAVNDSSRPSDLRFDVKVVDTDAPILSVADNSDGYFALTLRLRDKDLQRVASPRRMAVLWDVSTSMQAHHQANLDLLEKHLGQLQPETTELELVVFANSLISQQSYPLTVVGKQQLLHDIELLAYDGGTQLGALSEVFVSASVDYYILFSDGISSIGQGLPQPATAPVYAITPDAAINLPMLAKIATDSRGLVINPQAVGMRRAVRAIGKMLPPISVRGEHEGELQDILFDVAGSAELDLHIAGRINVQRSNLQVTVGDTVVRNYLLDSSGVTEGWLARQRWLQLKLAQLLPEPDANADEIMRLGMQYNAVTPLTTLIVLESIEQYAFYGIEPPPDHPDADEYEIEREFYEEDDPLASFSADVVRAAVVEQWQQRVEWWQASKPTTLAGAEQVRQLELDELEQQRREYRRRRAAQEEGRQGNQVQDDRANSGPAGFEEVVVTARKASESLPRGSSVLQVAAWSPDVPYLQVLAAAAPTDYYRVYLEQKQIYGSQPSFYMDCGQFFAQQGQLKLALRILSNVLESDPENPALERMVAYNLIEFGMYTDAIAILEHVRDLRPYEPTSYRDLARSWERVGVKTGDPAAFTTALQYYYEAVMGLRWQPDNPLRQIALMELNRLLPLAQAQGADIDLIDGQLVALLDVDLRVMLSWNSRNTDMDLWVTEPTGQKIYYNRRNSYAGGRMSEDITTGFGPEEYLNRYLLPGKYRFEVDYYGSSSLDLYGPATLTLDIYRNYGRADEQLKTVTLRLAEPKDRVFVGELEVSIDGARGHN